MSEICKFSKNSALFSLLLPGLFAYLFFFFETVLYARVSPILKVDMLAEYLDELICLIELITNTTSSFTHAGSDNGLISSKYLSKISSYIDSLTSDVQKDGPIYSSD